MKRNIICVHVGNKYSNDYVEKLYRSCVRNSTEDFIFTVLHDGKNYDLDGNINFVTVENMPFLSINNLWWYKLQSFRTDVAIAEQNLLLDLDLVIVNNIDKFWNIGIDKLVVLQDFNRHWYPSYNKCNSSVVKFTPDIARTLYDAFFNDPLQHIRKYRGDQDWLDDNYKDKIFWTKSWAMSWKWEVFNGGMIECNSNKYHDTRTMLKEDTSILVFHGKPDPHEVGEDVVKLNWI